MLTKIQKWFRSWKYREGRTLSHFIAKDVRREILIISAARIDEGIIIGRVRTVNMLYRALGLMPQSEFGPTEQLHLDKMWHWTGKRWGGLPDGKSIADQSRRGQSDA